MACAFLPALHSDCLHFLSSCIRDASHTADGNRQVHLFVIAPSTSHRSSFLWATEPRTALGDLSALVIAGRYPELTNLAAPVGGGIRLQGTLLICTVLASYECPPFIDDGASRFTSPGAVF